MILPCPTLKITAQLYLWDKYYKVCLVSEKKVGALFFMAELRIRNDKNYTHVGGISSSFFMTELRPFDFEMITSRRLWRTDCPIRHGQNSSFTNKEVASTFCHDAIPWELRVYWICDNVKSHGLLSLVFGTFCLITATKYLPYGD
jgi:hypothetical protein